MNNELNRYNYQVKPKMTSSREMFHPRSSAFALAKEIELISRHSRCDREIFGTWSRRSSALNLHPCRLPVLHTRTFGRRSELFERAFSRESSQKEYLCVGLLRYAIRGRIVSSLEEPRCCSFGLAVAVQASMKGIERE